MKKLTVTTFAMLLSVISVGVANAAITSQAYVDDNLAKKENLSNKTQTISAAASASTAKYPSEKAVATAIETATAGSVTNTDLEAYALRTYVDQQDATKVTANGAITGGTGTKITYDSKGLVTGSSSLTVSDLPDNIPASKIDNLATVATTGSYNDLTDTPDIPEGVTVDASLSEASTNPVQNKVIKAELDNINNRLDEKQDILTTLQQQAVNSGITADKVATYDGYATAKEDVSNKITGTTMDTNPETASGTKYTSEKTVASAIKNATSGMLTSADLEDYATTSYVDSGLANKLNTSTYDSEVGEVNATNMGTTATTVVTAIKEVAQEAADAQTTADAAIPKPSGSCSDGTSKCVLTFNGSIYEWEPIARNASGE